MNRKKNLIFLNRLVYGLEIVVSFLIIVGIIISLPDIIKYYYQILLSNAPLSYEIFKQFLSHILILVIGLEFILMMVAHSDNSIIYLMNFVIARKMLVYSDTTQELILGVVALFILFVIRKYLLVGRNDGSDDHGIIAANTSIRQINERHNYDIDAQNFISIGGLVNYLLEKRGLEVETGAIVDDKEYIYQIEHATHGVIDMVSIQKKIQLK